MTKRASNDILNLASEEAGFSFSDSDEKEKINLKKLLTNEKACGNINKLSQGIASEILKNKLVFRKFKLTVDNRLNL